MGATNTAEGSAWAPSFIAKAVNCEGKRILSANFFSGKRSRAENHAPREKAARWRKDIERCERGAARGAKTRAAEAARKKIRDANRGRRVHATRRCKTRERRRIADERRARERLREIPGVTQAEVQALPGDRVKRLRRVADVDLVAARAQAPHLERGHLHAARFGAGEAPRARRRDTRELGKKFALRHLGQAARAFGLQAPDE